MTAVATALPLILFAAALAGLLLPLRARRAAAALAVGAATAAFAASVWLAVGVSDGVRESVRTVADFGGPAVTAGVRIDPAAALVGVAVCAVALAVQVYSVAYLHDDERYPPYAAQVSLFTAAMLTVVVAADLIQLLVGWEVMGICSYLLIGHDRRLPEAPRAAVKAFLVTRVGDVGFLLGIAVLGIDAGSFRIADVLAADRSPAVAVTAGLLLLAGVAGKSAQFPLHTWLPDAMAGPTPISALIHAATMVASGVYVVARLFPVFDTGVVLTVLAVMATITMLLGALAAMAQADIKRVLAWSTVSQLGYMTGALAVAAPGAALFHLLTHAAFKALLFLAAGAVIHAVGTNLMADMGGLRTRMPVTFWSMTIGLAALAGLPPLAGFWSKDGILAVTQEAALEHGGAAWAVWLGAAVTVALTGWYAMRLWLLTFLGRYRGSGHPHEPPKAMGVPVALLAVPSALLGFAALGLGDRLGPGLEAHLSVAALLPLALAAAGAAGAWLMWRQPAGVPAGVPAAVPTGSAAAAAVGPAAAGYRDPADRLPARATLAAAFHLDAVQDALVTRPVQALARVVRRGDESIVDGAVEGTGRAAFGAGGLLNLAHRAGLPRAATAALTGAALLGVVAVALAVTR